MTCTLLLFIIQWITEYYSHSAFAPNRICVKLIAYLITLELSRIKYTNQHHFRRRLSSAYLNHCSQITTTKYHFQLHKWIKWYTFGQSTIDLTNWTLWFAYQSAEIGSCLKMIYFESIVVIVLSLCTIAPYASEEVNDVSETIRLVAPNCAISGLRNEQGDRSENVRTRIIIENCSNPSIPSSAFAHLNNIVSIDIIGSDVSAIDANAFDGLNVLERLSLTSNNLTTFHVWSNENLDAVTTLDLSLNQVRELEVNALRPYPNLEYLSLAFNWIAEIPIGFFGKISSIQTLHLDGNSIHRIEAETFKPLLLLEQLYLENNEISFIDKFAFSTLAHLKSMRLDGNQITALEPTLFFASPRLQQLNLSHNTLDALTMTFQENVELKVIDLSYNSISTLQSDALEGVESLEVRLFNSLTIIHGS